MTSDNQKLPIKFFFQIGWLNNDYCLNRKYFGFDVDNYNIASKFKNLVLILHAGKMYCAKTSSFRISRRSKWKTVHAFAFLLIHARAIGRSENPGGRGASSSVSSWHNMLPMNRVTWSSRIWGIHARRPHPQLWRPWFSMARPQALIWKRGEAVIVSSCGAHLFQKWFCWFSFYIGIVKRQLLQQYINLLICNVITKVQVSWTYWRGGESLVSGKIVNMYTNILSLFYFDNK